MLACVNRFILLYRVRGLCDVIMVVFYVWYLRTPVSSVASVIGCYPRGPGSSPTGGKVFMTFFC